MKGRKKRILVCPLDWGLGHATRCIPVIRELIAQGAEPLIGTSGDAELVLRDAFPHLEFVPLPSFTARYPGTNMWKNMALQLPAYLVSLWREFRQVQLLIEQKQIDGIISDHRYGCFSAAVPSVFLSHQLHLILPFPVLGPLVNSLHRYLIRRFHISWIPDIPEADGLGGKLSHPPLPLPSRYIGWLSRLEKIRAPEKYDLLILLSGPEPMRSRLENVLREQAQRLQQRVLLVRGKPGTANSGNHQEKEYLSAADLSIAIAASRLVVCRSGYSTLMDLAVMGKKALLIPTPGQTEQEYLARLLTQKGICYHMLQEEVDLQHGIRRSEDFAGFTGAGNEEALLGKAVEEFLR